MGEGAEDLGVENEAAERHALVPPSCPRSYHACVHSPPTHTTHSDAHAHGLARARASGTYV